MIQSGNQAILHGALEAGANYLSAYPITPSSDIIAEYVKQTAGDDQYDFLQTEDEIAAIHSAIGASLAGRKSFTPTSGPGFSLMQEGLGLGFAYHIPLVLINVQRQGPSTGMPTLFSQDTLLQTQYGTHGDHMALTFYPNSVQECFDVTISAFNAACESSSPVMLLSDAYLARMHENVKFDNQQPIAQFPFERFGNGTRHFTGLTNDNGRPDTKNPETFKKWMKYLTGSIIETAKKYELYDYLPNSASETLIISFGSISRAINQWKNEFALFRPVRIFPLLKEQLAKVEQDYKNIVVVEGNYGQYRDVVAAALHREIKSVPVVGGEINPEEIYQNIKKVIE